MEIKVIGTGSAGNCYALTYENDTLVLECGMKLTQLKKAIDFKLSNVNGVVVTHEHGDHAKYIKEYLKAGLNVYGSQKMFDLLGLGNNVFCHGVIQEQRTKLGAFEIIPFKVNHDSVEPLNYLIIHSKFGAILFVTDTNKIPYTFRGVRAYLIEANFSEQKLKDNFYNAENGKWINTRVLNSHLSIEGCVRYLNQCDLSKVEKIILIHLSDTQGDEKTFKQKVIEATGCDTSVASNGSTYNLF